MTNLSKSNWSDQEIAKVRSIMSNASTPKEGLTIAARETGRSEQAISFKWYTHIKKIRTTPNTITETVEVTDNTIDSLTTKETRDVFVDMKGQYHFSYRAAKEANIEAILEEIEDAPLLYEYIVNNRTKIEYLLNSKSND